MSFLDQMKLKPFIELGLILILASEISGQKWHVDVPRNIAAAMHSNVTIPCTFTYPPEQRKGHVKAFWKVFEKSTFKINDNDKNAFIFHPNDTFVIEEYRRKTSLIGDINNRNCSLMISTISHSVGPIYLRIDIGGEYYSFKMQHVFITVPGSSVKTLPDDEFTTVPLEVTKVPMDLKTSTSIYIFTCVPIAAVVIMILVTGFVYYRKHKRSQSVIREDSGYYANFSRTTSQAKREQSFTKQDRKQASQPKVTEPIYINVQAPIGQMGSMDQADNVYANVDYSKE